jgi:tetratricopeptide (TPR) repeat protein
MKSFLRSGKITVSLLVLVLIGGAGCTKQMRKARYIKAGDKDFAAANYDRAEIEYLSALRFPPPDGHALTRLGTIYHNEGQWAKGTVWLNRAIEQEPKNSEARIELGLTELVLHQFKDAREQAQAVLAREPQNTEALLLLTASSTSTQELAQAAKVLDEVSPDGQNKPGYHLARGALCLRQVDLAKAEAEYRQELVIQPKSSQAYEALGNLLLMRQDFGQAEAAFKSAVELAPLRAGARLTYADLRIRKGEGTEGMREIRELVKKAPDFLPAWLFLANAAAARGDRDELEDSLKKVLARDPINIEALTLNGSLMLARGDGTNAVAMFERILKTYSPGPPQIHYSVALAHLMNNDIGKAVLSVNTALALQTNYPDAILLQARLNLRQGYAEAAISSLERLTQQQPQLAAAQDELARAYTGRKQYDEAAKVYRQMMQVFTNSVEAPYNHGMMLMLQSKTNEARHAFEKSLAINPDFLPAIEQLVELDLVAGRVSEATDRVNVLIEKYPKSAPLRVLLARIYVHKAEALRTGTNEQNTTTLRLAATNVPAAKENIDQAEAALLKAIELSPDSRTAYQLLASLYVSSSRYQDALKRLDTLLARTNDLPSLFEKAVIQEQIKDYTAARDTYEKIITIEPRAGDALNNLAFLLAEHFGQVARAYDLAQQARKLQPGNPSVADTLGWILYRRGDYPAAGRLLEEAAQKLANDEVQCHLGLAKYMYGEEQAAHEALERAVKSPKDFAGKRDAGAALEILAINAAIPADKARPKLEERLRKVPDDPVALQRMAAIQEQAGQSAEAARNYERILKISPKNAPVLFSLAGIYRNLGQSQKAIEAAKAAHAAAPDDSRISALLGRLAFESNDFPWAASLLQESAPKLPNDPQVLYDLAWSQYALGHVTEATNAMQRAIAFGREFTNAQSAKQFLAMTAAAQDPAQAESLAAEAERILGANPAYVPALMVCAPVAERRGDFKQAAQLYERVLARFPLFAPATRNLAILSFAQLQNEKRAYELAIKAREAFPTDAELARTLAILSFRRGEYARCARLLTLNSPEAKPDGEQLCYLGLAQYKLNQYAQSKATLQQALALNAPANLIDAAKKALAELK